MKQDIHPTYQDKIQVTCSCGNSFETGSTAKELSVEVCAACHPFYTGKSKMVDAAGRVDRFQQRLKDSASKQEKALKAKKKDTKKDSDKKDDTTVKLG